MTLGRPSALGLRFLSYTVELMPLASRQVKSGPKWPGLGVLDPSLSPLCWSSLVMLLMRTGVMSTVLQYWGSFILTEAQRTLQNNEKTELCPRHTGLQNVDTVVTGPESG